MTATERRPSWPDPSRLTLEVLVVRGCPGTELAIARVREAIELLDLEANVRFLIIDDERGAEKHRFVGSPTVRVDGVDVEPGADERPVGLACRVYRSEGVVERAPPLAWIRDALTNGVGSQTRAKKR